MVLGLTATIDMETDMAQQIVLLPGIGNSGPGHWQRIWADSDAGMTLIDGQDWDQPVREQWVENLDRTLRRVGPETILVAHSLGCLQVIHWAQARDVRIAGAMLVAPPDPQGPAFPSQASGFGDLPMQRLAFPTLVVASSDDPYASLDFSRRCAEAWGGRFVEVGARGHINGQSGLGDWTQGRELLDALRVSAAG